MYISLLVNFYKSYAEVLNDVRGKIKAFRKSNPVAAFGTEIAGSIPSMILAQFIPGAGQTATALRGAQLARAIGIGARGQKIGGAALRGAGASGLYGFGAGEGGAENRLKSAGTSAAIGAVVNPAIQSIAPRITEGAKELIKKGDSYFDNWKLHSDYLSEQNVYKINEKQTLELR